ncbi:MAG: succinate--CoA ligase subunit alpha [Thermoprotei archaeon]|nr:MAG: succinate--CoA ligase subunit alpha [Thermoprotei archaeon]RLE77996.1 MAG: succinate--CoA ligase subunit alpha [Thermoprotei archaeon]
MPILVNEDTRLLVQGITGREGSFHTKLMLDYGTKILAGVTPGKGGQRVHGIPVYDSVDEAIEKHPEINTSIVFVPAKFAYDAVLEAVNCGIELIVVITEHIPVHDSLKFIRYAKYRRSLIVGPNTPGVISPGLSKVGIMPGKVFKRGRIGLVSRSGTLTYEVANEISKSGLGISTSVGIGGDPVNGLDFIETAKFFLEDENTDALVIVGEIGGDAEERFASFIEKTGFEKPVVAYITGRTAPPGKRMGHAGAIISMGTGDAKSKIEALNNAGIQVAETVSSIPKILFNLLK